MGKLIPERPRSEAVAPDLTLPHIARALRRTARVAGLIPPLVGLVVLSGWAVDVEILKRIVPSPAASAPVTAVAFIFLGLSLTILCHKALHWTRPVAVAFALVPLAIGLSEVAAVWGLVDLQLRMAPNTALNFVLLALALITIDRG